MIAVLPEAKGPCSSMVSTLGFHSPQVEVSDQIFHTLSAGAVLTTEVPYSGMARILLSRYEVQRYPSRLRHRFRDQQQRNLHRIPGPRRGARSRRRAFVADTA